MSASTDSSATDVDHGSENEAPQLSALFLIRFDKKVGYTIAWKRTTTPDVSLDGAVEFKSLPSGLHSLDNDLVYFVHEGYAGLSAFAKGDASEAERNASFVAVGILVSRSYGRLGRSWLLAGRLTGIARALADDPDATTPLEEFWEEQSKSRSSSSPSASTSASASGSGSIPKQGQPKGHSRARALSTITAVIPSDQSLPPYHPALSIIQYIDVFGPLVFRLQQAALLRKRILFVGAPPVRGMCEFVYNLSVLSSISPRDAELLSPGTESLLRLPSLFSVGVHDIPALEKFRSSKPQTQSNGTQSAGDEIPSEGWVACTTDEIITTKKQLYDIVVELPPTYDAAPQKRKWPTIRTSDGTQIKASQRDVWRYKFLHRELWRHKRHASATNGDTEDDDEQVRLLSKDEVDEADDEFNESYDDSVVEPMSWSRLAYLGFMWWASAGEKDAYTTAERDLDREILGDLSDYSASLPTAVIAYFHRSTTLLIQSLNGLVEREDDGEDSDEERIVVDKDDLSRMGLDTWSEADKAFVQEFVWMYFGRAAAVEGASLECCGMRVPVF